MPFFVLVDRSWMAHWRLCLWLLWSARGRCRHRRRCNDALVPPPTPRLPQLAPSDRHDGRPLPTVLFPLL